MLSSLATLFTLQPLPVRILIVFVAGWILCKGLLASAYDAVDFLICIIERFESTDKDEPED